MTLRVGEIMYNYRRVHMGCSIWEATDVQAAYRHMYIDIYAEMRVYLPTLRNMWYLSFFRSYRTKINTKLSLEVRVS